LERVEVGGEFHMLDIPTLSNSSAEQISFRLVDVPGFGDVNTQRESVAARALENSEKIIICANAARAGSDSQIVEYLKTDALQELQMKNTGRGKLIFCATKSDQEDVDLEWAEDAEDPREVHNNTVRDNVKTMLAEKFKYGEDVPIVVGSSRKYFEIINKNNNADPSDSSATHDGYTLDTTEIPYLSRLVFSTLW